MPLVVNRRVVFNAIPSGPPDAAVFAYKVNDMIDPETVDIMGGLLVKVLAVSLDPYMRNRMRPIEEKGDMPAFELGEDITGFAVGQVLRSDVEDIAAGQHVYGFMPYKQYAVFPTTTANSFAMSGLGLAVVENKYNLPWHYFVGGLGTSGQTAFFGLKDLSDPQPGQRIYISAACGAVGHMVVQLAKILGLKVIASCGSDDKVALVKSLGADHVFNYKTSDVGGELKTHGPINIYFDNVGGQTLETAIEHAAMHARFVICGMVSTYNAKMSESYGIRNLWLFNRYRIRMEGMVTTDWNEKYLQEFFDTVPAYISQGKVNYLADVSYGLENAGEAFARMMKGETIGKAVVVLEG